jgi:hypothetical protein
MMTKKAFVNISRSHCTTTYPLPTVRVRPPIPKLRDWGHLPIKRSIGIPTWLLVGTQLLSLSSGASNLAVAMAFGQLVFIRKDPSLLTGRFFRFKIYIMSVDIDFF